MLALWLWNSCVFLCLPWLNFFHWFVQPHTGTQSHKHSFIFHRTQLNLDIYFYMQKMLTHYFCNGNIWQFIFYSVSECLVCCLRFIPIFKVWEGKLYLVCLAILAQLLFFLVSFGKLFFTSRYLIDLAFLFGIFFFQCSKVLIIFSSSARSLFGCMYALAEHLFLPTPPPH